MNKSLNVASTFFALAEVVDRVIHTDSTSKVGALSDTEEYEQSGKTLLSEGAIYKSTKNSSLWIWQYSVTWLVAEGGFVTC